jgi:uncharacterized protein
VARIQLVVKLNAKWMRDFLAYDPAPDLARITVPVLAITGSRDLQVDPADLQTMAELTTGAFERHLLPGVTHLMRPDSGAPRGLRATGSRRSSRWTRRSLTT